MAAPTHCLPMQVPPPVHVLTAPGEVQAVPALPELDEQGTKSLAQPLDGGVADAMLVDMSGKTTRLIGAIVPDGSRTWFYKLMGSPAIAEAEKAALVRFIQSAKHANGG